MASVDARTPATTWDVWSSVNSTWMHCQPEQVWWMSSINSMLDSRSIPQTHFAPLQPFFALTKPLTSWPSSVARCPFSRWAWELTSGVPTHRSSLSKGDGGWWVGQAYERLYHWTSMPNYAIKKSIPIWCTMGTTCPKHHAFHVQLLQQLRYNENNIREAFETSLAAGGKGTGTRVLPKTVCFRSHHKNIGRCSRWTHVI